MLTVTIWKNICYETEDKRFSLQKISLDIEANKKYVVIGSSGCGKTTLLKVLANIIAPTSGYIYLNGKEYEDSENVVSNIVSLVHQDTFIFNDTIENNIQLYQNYSIEELNYAISMTELKENLQDRIKTDCLEGGRSLSGGEKQRIAIARAILRDSPVLLLDEITSSLDTITARKILKNLFELHEKTLVFVTHKMEKEFLKKADCILCMDQGAIIESGSWEALINEKGYFYKLYAAE